LACSTFEVAVNWRYVENLIDQDFDLEKVKLLVNLSFDFLLDREPPSAILKSFNLQDIRTYFPEYEEEIKKKFLNQ
jgi:hypothetical protein